MLMYKVNRINNFNKILTPEDVTTPIIIKPKEDIVVNATSNYILFKKLSTRLNEELSKLEKHPDEKQEIKDFYYSHTDIRKLKYDKQNEKR